MLESALRELGDGSRDEHVEDLARRVRGVVGKGKGEEVVTTEGKGKGITDEAVEREVERIESGKGHGRLEEVEK